MRDQKFDEFLDEAAHAVHRIWQKKGGDALTEDDLCELNDLLSDFFKDRS